MKLLQCLSFAVLWVSLLFSCQPPSKVSDRAERIVCTDSATSAVLWQLSNSDSMSLMPYFEAQAFTYDDQYAVFKSKREGDWKLYRSELSSGIVTKLSDRVVSGSFTINPTGSEVSFMVENVIYAIDVETLAERIMIDLNGMIIAERISFSSSFTDDGYYTVISATNEDRSVDIYRVNLKVRTVEKAYTAPTGCSHTLINPLYPDFITFVPAPDKQNDYSLSPTERARTWIIRMDKGEAKPFLMMPSGSRATHETWTKNGERFTFFKKWYNAEKGGFDKVSICSVNKEGDDFQEHFITNRFKIGHGITSTDGKYFVSDVQEQHINPIFVLNMETSEAAIVCWANASQTAKVNTQHEHVHPFFSRSGRYIGFSSDRNTPGTPQAFALPLEEIYLKPQKSDNQ